MRRVLAASLIALAGVSRAADPGPGQVRVTGWIAFNYGFEDSFRDLLRHADRMSELQPFWFFPLPDGSVTEYEPDASGVNGKRIDQVESMVKSICAAHGIKLIPCVGEPGEKYKGLTASIFHDPALRSRHARYLADFVVARGYDGIDIDYESLGARERDSFTAFFAELGGLLHAKGKLLSLAVAAKTSSPGDWDAPQSADWPALGKLVDRVRIMAYDYKEDSSDPGPIAPLDWFKSILAYALTAIPAEKIVMGIPVYGYDWDKPGAAEEVQTKDAPDLAKRHGAEIVWDPVVGASHFSYKNDPFVNQVWYEDERALAPKLQALQAAGCYGIAVWRLSEETEDWWTEVSKPVPAAVLPATAPSATTASR